jgi:transcriptional regulator of heat shock response
MTAVEKKDELYRMVKNAGVMEVSVRIGSELGEDIFKDCSLVTATYSIGEEPVGVMGIIGPTRMQYGKVVSVLEPGRHIDQSFRGGVMLHERRKEERSRTGNRKGT